MDDLHTDGNAMAGLLSELLAVDATTIVRRCHSCAEDRAIADHLAYHGAGVVLRCPACGDVALRLVVTETGLTAEPRGAFRVTRAG